MKVYKYSSGSKINVAERHAKNEAIVLDAIKRLGGKIQMRVMEFRRHLSEPMRETHIKEALKRLVEKGVIEMTGERFDSRGHAYKIN